MCEAVVRVSMRACGVFVESGESCEEFRTALTREKGQASARGIDSGPSCSSPVASRESTRLEWLEGEPLAVIPFGSFICDYWGGMAQARSTPILRRRARFAK